MLEKKMTLTGRYTRVIYFLSCCSEKVCFLMSLKALLGYWENTVWKRTTQFEWNRESSNEASSIFSPLFMPQLLAKRRKGVTMGLYLENTL